MDDITGGSVRIYIQSKEHESEQIQMRSLLNRFSWLRWAFRTFRKFIRPASVSNLFYQLLTNLKSVNISAALLKHLVQQARCFTWNSAEHRQGFSGLVSCRLTSPNKRRDYTATAFLIPNTVCTSRVLMSMFSCTLCYHSHIWGFRDQLEPRWLFLNDLWWNAAPLLHAVHVQGTLEKPTQS